jgi:hypothetical protein
MDYQGLSGSIMDYQGLSGIIRDHQGLSGTIRDYQRLSRTIREFFEMESMESMDSGSYGFLRIHRNCNEFLEMHGIQFPLGEWSMQPFPQEEWFSRA